MADRIAALIPTDTVGYVEPFCGALSVLLAKTPSPAEVANDLDHKIITFWRVLRDRPDELERVCALTPHSRIEARTALVTDPSDELELARQVWVALTQHRAAVMRHTPGWRFTHGGNRMPLSASSPTAPTKRTCFTSTRPTSARPAPVRTASTTAR